MKIPTNPAPGTKLVFTAGEVGRVPPGGYCILDDYIWCWRRMISEGSYPVVTLTEIIPPDEPITAMYEPTCREMVERSILDSTKGVFDVLRIVADQIDTLEKRLP